MRFLRVVLSALLIATTLAIAPVPAPAADGPPTGPQLIHSYGFEGTGWSNSGAFTPVYDSHWTIGKNPQPPTGVYATYVWGPEPSSKHNGSYGLWCSAYNTTSKWYSFNWATYLKDTSTRATLSLPELSNYYSSQLQFWYLMPSRGAADYGSFVLAWGPPPIDYDTWESDTSFLLTSQWTKLTYDLTDELSRKSGEIWWEFNNKVEGGSQYPTAGQGATLDDVAVYGYKYGPVLDIGSRATASGLELTWSRPHASADSPAEETRDLTYRVWRRPTSGTTWTEVTTTRLDDPASRVSFTDSTAIQGVDYTYRIVAYDPGTGTGYGEIVDCTSRMPELRLSISGSASPSIMLPGTPTEFTYRVTNTGEVTVSELEIIDFLGVYPGVVPDSLAPGAAFEVTRDATIDSSLTNTVEVSGEALGIPVTSFYDVDVTVVDPAVTISAQATPAEIDSGDSTTLSYQVTNTGDTLLENITVTDVYGAVITGVPSTLAIGASFTVQRTASPTADLSDQVTVSASGSGFVVDDQDVVDVTVNHPSLSIDLTVDPASIIRGSSATFTYDVTNTGDCDLTGIELSDTLGTLTAGVPATLASGDSFQTTRIVSPDAPLLNEAVVTGFGATSQVSANDAALLQVREPNPDIEVTATVSPTVVAVPDSATFTYNVTNTGNVPIDTIALADSFGVLTSGVSTSLDPGESFTVDRVVAPSNSVLNEVTVTGVSGTTNVSSTDSAYLQVTHPSVGVVVSVNPSAIADGSSATFTYTITNTSDTTLGSITVSDDVGVITAGVPSTLAIGQSFQVQRTISPSNSLDMNVSVSAVGTGKTVTDTDSASLTVTHPSVTVQASVDPAAITEGSSATFTYRVTNSGDVSLSGISVIDDSGPITTGVPSTLASGAYVDVTRTMSPSDSLDMDVSVSAVGTGKTVTDTDSASLTVTHPSATVVAAIDANPCVDGEQATFRYTITNTGDVAFTQIAVTDAFGAVTTGVPASLDPGAHFTATRTRTMTDGGTNVVTFTATVTGGSIERNDSIDYEVVHPRLDLAVAPFARGVAANSAADFSVVLSNPGDVALTDVQVSARIGSIVVDSQQIDSLAAKASRSLLLSPVIKGDPGDVIDVVIEASADYGAGQDWAGQLGPESRSVQAQVIDSRVQGTDRISTAIKASQQAFESGGADAVVIATGYDFPDALSAAGLAGAANGPLLLVDGESISAGVISEIKRLQPTRAYLVGGTSVLSTTVESQLKLLQGSSGMPSNFRVMPRISGSNRYATARAVGAEIDRLGGDTSTVFLATGLNFPDALAASSLSARMTAPTLLTQPTSLPSDTDAALRSLQPDLVVICGGTSAVSATIASKIAASSAYGRPTVIRLAGDNRYETAQKLVDWAGSGVGTSPDLAPDGVDGIYLATGENYPDALAGGVLAGIGGSQWRPLMLTAPTALNPQVKSYISANGSIGFVSGVGGPAVLSDQVLISARAAIQ